MTSWDGRMMPSEQMATAQSLVRDIEVRSARWDDPPRPLVAPAGAKGGRDRLAWFCRARRLLPPRGRDAGCQARVRRDRRRLPRPRPQPRPAGRGQAVRRPGGRSRRASWRGPHASCPRCLGLCWHTPMAARSPFASRWRELARSRGWSSRTPRCGSRCRSRRASSSWAGLLARIAPWITLTGRQPHGRPDPRPRDSGRAPHRPVAPQSHQSAPFLRDGRGGRDAPGPGRPRFELPFLMLLGGQDTVIDPDDLARVFRPARQRRQNPCSSIPRCSTNP